MIVRNFFDVAHSNNYYVADVTEYQYPNVLLAIGMIFIRKKRNIKVLYAQNNKFHMRLFYSNVSYIRSLNELQ